MKSSSLFRTNISPQQLILLHLSCCTFAKCISSKWFLLQCFIQMEKVTSWVTGSLMLHDTVTTAENRLLPFFNIMFPLGHWGVVSLSQGDTFHTIPVTRKRTFIYFWHFSLFQSFSMPFLPFSLSVTCCLFPVFFLSVYPSVILKWLSHSEDLSFVIVFQCAILL